MAKKPHTRTLCAEPLEERLPVSSSAAGVLLGFGLASPEKEPGVPTPGYEATNTPSLTTRFEFDDTTLAATLDAMTVDRILGEDASDTTPGLASGALSSDADPFEVTPLSATEGLSDDAATDSVRQLGDELLLIQISTLDFVQGQFEYLSPIMSLFDSNDQISAISMEDDFTNTKSFDSILERVELIPTITIDPVDPVDYGYSPIIHEIEHEPTNMLMAGCGCGCTPSNVRISSACIAGTISDTHAGYISTGCNAGLYNYYPADVTALSLQGGNSATVVASMSWTGGGSASITVNSPDGYWNVEYHVIGGGSSGTQSFTWTKPANIMNEDAKRDFTFTFTAVGGNSVVLGVHIGYIELRGYAKQAVRGTTVAFDENLSVGHSGWGCYVDPHPKVYEYITQSWNWHWTQEVLFWKNANCDFGYHPIAIPPLSPTELITGFGVTRNGIVLNDNGWSWDVVKEWTINRDQFWQILQATDDLRASPGTWSLLTHNCTHVALSMVHIVDPFFPSSNCIPGVFGENMVAAGGRKLY